VGVNADLARNVVESLIPTEFQVIKQTVLYSRKPEEALPAEERKGDELRKGKAVAVAEKIPGYARICKPHQGWLPMDEIQKKEAGGEEGSCKTEDVSALLRHVQNYNLIALQRMSDDNFWGLDFVKLAQAQIISKLLAKHKYYSRNVILRGVMGKTIDVYRACLKAIQRKDYSFIVDALGLPKPPGPPKKKS